MTLQEPSKRTIGFIGLGHMGRHMVPRLIAVGYHVTVYDRTREKAQAIQGATVAETPREAAAHSEVVISIVTDDAALDEVMLGPDGVLAGTHAGSVLIDMSTVSPRASRHLFQEARARGVAMIDAAVAGSVPQVEQGSLLIFVGGEQETYERCFRQLTFSEIGHTLNMPETTVKTYFYRSLLRVRRALESTVQWASIS